MSVFVLTLAADITWSPRLLPLALVSLNGWLLARTFARFAADGSSAAHLTMIQAVTPVLVLLILQSCAFVLDTQGWGRWQLWRWIIAATGLLVAYSLLH